MGAFPTARVLSPSAFGPLPDLRRPNQHIVRIERGQKEPPPAVEEAALHDVHAEEAPERPQQEVAHARSSPLSHCFLPGAPRLAVRSRPAVAAGATRAGPAVAVPASHAATH